MDMNVTNKTSVDLRSLVDSHEKPFVVIDKNYRILAFNKAYEKAYVEKNGSAIGKTCYQVSHGKNQPCNLDGEDCPHQHVFKTGKSKVSLHVHLEKDHHMHQVKVTAFSLRDSNNELLLGECLEEIKPVPNHLSESKLMVGESAEFMAFADQLNIAASSDAPILLQGETGTGKELAAEYIHSHSSRRHKPFQIVDSTVLSDNLFESEMFGHVNGAFTGSVGAKQGLIEMAEGGSLFLDEIGDMPILQQAKLLRVLESGQYRPVGGKKIHKANVRIICATNRNLWESVLAGTFRQDMYYRIAVLNIHLPSLRERINDIPVLTHNLLAGINHSMGSNFQILPEVYDSLEAYQYPGNIRELRNILFIATTHSKNNLIDAELINKVLNNQMYNNPLTHTESSKIINLKPLGSVSEVTNTDVSKNEESTSLKGIEEKHIRELLVHYQGNRKQVADILGISERTIYRKIKRFGIG